MLSAVICLAGTAWSVQAADQPATDKQVEQSGTVTPAEQPATSTGVEQPGTAKQKEQAGTDEKMEMEAIGVTAKRESLQVYSPYAVPESAELTTEVITAEEIQAINPRDFYDLLSRAAGVTASYQGRKYLNLFSLRGGENGSVGIIVDGVYIPNAQASRILMQFPVDTIESVRFVRDSTSLTLGPLMDVGTAISSPNQGFIIITTKKGNSFGGGINAEYGSYNEREYQAYHGNKIGDFNYRITATDENNPGPSGWFLNQKAYSFLFNGGYDGQSLKVNTTVYYSEGMRDEEHSFTNTTNNAYWGYDPMKALWMAISVNKLWTPSQVTSLSYSHGMLTDNEVMGSDPGKVVNNPQAVVTTFQWQSDYADNYHLWHTSTIGDNTAKIGMQAIHWNEPHGYASYDGKHAEENLIGGYVQDEQRFGKLAIDGGLRIEDKYIEYNAAETSGKNKVWTPTSTEFSVGAAYKFNPVYKATARFGYSDAATDPTLTTLNNAVLPAENRYKYEAGFEANLHPAFNPCLTLFYYDIRNYKLEVSSIGTGLNQIYVYGDANVTRQGLELSTVGSLSYGFSYKFDYTHIQYIGGVATTSQGVTVVGVPAKIQYPSDIFSVLLSNRYGPIETNFTIYYDGPFQNNQFTSPSQYVNVGGFTRIDANVAYYYNIDKLKGKIMVFAQNMLNDHYQTVNGFRDVGLTYGARLELNF